MDYKEKYEQAIEDIKKIKDANKDNKELVDFIEYKYPELKESEDERMIKSFKRLIDAFHSVNFPTPEGFEIEDMNAWLEKQGEKIDKLVKYREWLISETERWTEKENDKTNSNAGKHCCIGAANALISARAEFEEIFDYESWHKNVRDKVEPKFKVGDWITNGACTIQITSVDDTYYWHDNDCVGGDIESMDKEYHLWTIQDAKDGDVLANDNSIIIFRSIGNYRWNDAINYYVAYKHNLDKIVIQHNDSYYGTVNTITFEPATKEQIDLLSQKMKEAGYEWDAEKKELKKIEQKPV